MRNDPVANSINNFGSPATEDRDATLVLALDSEVKAALSFIIDDPEARAVLHIQGHSKSIVPIGLSNLAS